MFQSLCKDLVQEIFEFDSTYHEEFSRILNTMVTEEMKALQYFLHWCRNVPDLTTERFFQNMKLLHVDVGLERTFIEIQFENHKKMAFYVLPLDEKDRFDFPKDSSSLLIVKQYLYQLPFSIISEVLEITEEELGDLLKEEEEVIDNPRVLNKVLFDLLGCRGYSKVVYKLIDNGMYNNIVHRYLFEKLFREIDDIYFLEEGENYRHFKYNHEDYIVYWHLYTNTLV